MERFGKIIEAVSSKVLQYLTSIAGGLLVAFEASIPFFVPCLIATVVDIWAAYCLARRVHKGYPDRADGKFKSEYKYRIMYTMIIALLAIMLANYVDVHVVKESDLAVRWVMGFSCSTRAGASWRTGARKMTTRSPGPSSELWSIRPSGTSMYPWRI